MPPQFQSPTLIPPPSLESVNLLAGHDFSLLAAAQLLLQLAFTACLTAMTAVEYVGAYVELPIGANYLTGIILGGIAFANLCAIRLGPKIMSACVGIHVRGGLFFTLSYEDTYLVLSYLEAPHYGGARFGCCRRVGKTGERPLPCELEDRPTPGSKSQGDGWPDLPGHLYRLPWECWLRPCVIFFFLSFPASHGALTTSPRRAVAPLHVPFMRSKGNVYSKVVRNLHFITILNLPLVLAMFAVLPIQEIIDNRSVFASLALAAGGNGFRLWITIDAFLIMFVEPCRVSSFIHVDGVFPFADVDLRRKPKRAASPSSSEWRRIGSSRQFISKLSRSLEHRSFRS